MFILQNLTQFDMFPHFTIFIKNNPATFLTNKVKITGLYKVSLVHFLFYSWKNNCHFK